MVLIIRYNFSITFPLAVIFQLSADFAVREIQRESSAQDFVRLDQNKLEPHLIYAD